MDYKNFIVNFSYSNDYEYFTPYKINFYDFYKVVSSDKYYSASTFKNNKRLNENYIPGKNNVIILDFDDNKTIEEVNDIFRKYIFLLATTRNHNKNKNGITCERFRLILPLMDIISLEKKEFSRMMSYLTKITCADKSASDPARFFFGYNKCHWGYNYIGKLFNWYYIWEKSKNENINFEYNKEYKQKKFIKTKNDLRKIIGDNSKMHKTFRPEEIIKGNRNNMFARYVLWMRDEGFSLYECEKCLKWINANISDPLSENEIVTIMKGKYK